MTLWILDTLTLNGVLVLLWYLDQHYLVILLALWVGMYTQIRSRLERSVVDGRERLG